MNNVLVTLPVNLSEFMQSPFTYAFAPYIALLGVFTWGIIMGFMGAAIYVSSERQTFTVLGYLVLVGVSFAVLLPAGLAYILGLTMAFIVTAILFKIFVDR